MLTDLHIRDFVIAKELELEFEHGLSVLTGETGAGKSILIDALGLVLGERADSQSVRQGADKAELSAVFDIAKQKQALEWLKRHELDSDTECVVRRVVHSTGRSKAFINGKPTPAQQLKELGSLLVDIHGQHEHQAMLKPTVQRELLDSFGKQSALDKTAAAYDQWKEQQDALTELRGKLEQRGARLDLIRFQTDELSRLAPVEGEFESLSEEQFRLSHVATLAESSLEAIGALSTDNNSVQSKLAFARKQLAQITGIDAKLEEYDQLLDSAEIQIEEALSGLQRYADELEMDPARRDFVESRLDGLAGQAKKHRVDPEQLVQHLDSLNAELIELETAEESIAELESAVDEAAKAYLAVARKLSAARRKSAKTMGKDIGQLVQELGMPDCEFTVDVTSDAKGPFRRNGIDTVQFMIQANKGETARPVSKVASGGELSRVSLAVQVISASADSSSCMVFDEVDAGVGGAVADMIGQRLQELGSRRQVLAVTHLPQVACHGHQHFKVSKTTLDNRTRSQVVELKGADRVEELARMLGGAKLTTTTRRHAKELLTQALKLRTA
ncbi:MAG: DNA repair protein RecN [Gammaproteobacteria bacterium]